MAYFTPTVLPMIAVANIWLFFCTPQYGLLEQISGLFGLPSHNWLGSPSAALGAVTVVAIWKEAGFFMIFYLAALQTLNPSVREAAAIEGASRWYFFRRVQWPLLMPTTLFVLINAVINAFRMVDHFRHPGMCGEADQGVVAVPARELLERRAATCVVPWEFGCDEQLPGAEIRFIQALEKRACRHPSLPEPARDHEARIQREAARRQLGRGIGERDATAERAAVAHGGVGDVGHRLRDERQMARDLW
jgi:hypothetical protein